ncbi:3-keto-5-aminohexanoate cleavage enzyme [Pleomorphomonas diazotrophica]|uniref:3-keto-5-aminohexanoate cleavage enzyme n=1 Tax=Pleomorphomonas diazotrophica TaxID=1166257 RepID=A0A1I4S506_9HYPH|nr:3-keto-5-aminohexanoate cleavage protein [Pleomorphomonas diazotrophica]PKR89948.1 3-keto-5-aminohexanoate cleavage enzyme [Pleomorphomonas diazotrophica]SFM59529.1 Uncharacterized conserved protein, DUF849 family [Pleomorphomonas diazotrophica]
MIVQACINGARPFDYHPALPLTVEAMARDSAACISAGAAEVHLHARAADGRESLSAVDETIRLVRRTCPGTLVGVSTGAWIEGEPRRTREAIAGWRVLPDYASVNLSEPDAPAVIDLLHGMGVGVEAGLATVEDARRFVALEEGRRIFRILIEIDHEQDIQKGEDIVNGIASVLGEAGIARPTLLHGFDATVWHFVGLAQQRRWSTRVGLEDGCRRVTGEVARDNAQLVTDAVRMMR